MAARDIQALMWREVGLFRDRSGLESALAVLEPAWRETRRGAAIGRPRSTPRLAHGEPPDRRTPDRARGARREESRGGHYRADYPARDDIHWKRRRLTDAL